MQTILFVDLDDTLFQSKRARPPKASWTVGARLKDNSPISYLSEKESHWLTIWRHITPIIIPVTARNHDAFSRVELTFTHEAVISHGAIILEKNKQLCPIWQARMADNHQEKLAKLSHYQQKLNELADEHQIPVYVRLITDHDVPCYVMAKSEQHDQAHIEQLASLIKEHGLIKDGLIDSNPNNQPKQPSDTLHVNRNNLAIIPHWLDKAHAVYELKQRYQAQFQDILCVGMGDSLTDLGFMQLCDFWVTPTHGQIAQANRTHIPQQVQDLLK